MDPQRTNGASRELRVDEVIADYLEAVEAGLSTAPEEWLRRFPELAPQLGRYFSDQRRFEDLLAAVNCAPAPEQNVSSPAEGRRPAASGEVAPGPITAGSSFSDYELLEEIARGGMGVVYKAWQRSLRRKLALKMILAGRLASAADVRRFRTEAESAAQLDHPNIVPIYEIGEHEGQHYFTMKLIEGGNLAEHAARFIAEPRSAAALVAKVAAAVHHAHQRGVLHRDLKPANILLDAKGEPHLTDFGLARQMHGHLSLTQSGMAVGTPSYMAPEQALGPSREVTTAADVYSLGAILYELVTGRPPFRAETALRTLRQALEGDPEPPRALNPCVHRDLQTICLKCLNREPAARYPSALGLADDLERFLEGKAIRARVAGPLERCGRWFRRSPVVAGLGVALALSLLVGGGLATWQWWKAVNHARLAETERARADRAFRQAHQAVNDFCARVNDARLQGAPGQQGLHRELLEVALPYYEQFVQEYGQDGALRTELADTHFRIGTITAALGPAPKAIKAYQRARSIYQALLRDDPGSFQVRKALAQVHSRLGIVQAATGEPAAADDDRNRANSNQYGHLAMETLREAIRAGYRDRTRVREDPALEPLRKRHDFVRLLESAGGSPAPPQRLEE